MAGQEPGGEDGEQAAWTLALHTMHDPTCYVAACRC